MAASRIPILTDEGSIGNSELLDQLNVAVGELAVQMKATVPIKRNGHRVGFGVDKAQRVITADRVISIAKVIKAMKGW